MSRAEMAAALEAFAADFFASLSPPALANAVVLDMRPPGWPTEEHGEPSEPAHNALAIIEIREQARPSADEQPAAGKLREALDADPRLGGLSNTSVRVLPEDPGDVNQVQLLVHVDDP